MSWYHTLDLPQLQQNFGSPCWVIHPEQIKANIDEVCRFTEVPHRILYPVKTNPAPAVLQYMARYGVGADCANIQEINAALFAGIPPSHIVYNSPHNDLDTCLSILKQGGAAVLDDVQVIAQLENHDLGVLPGQLWLRINPLERDTYTGDIANKELMAHGSASSKFGVPEEDVTELLSRTTLRFTGLHLHVGTQMDNLNAFRTALSTLYQVAEAALTLGHPIRAIDVGGGLGIPFTDKDNFPTIAAWADTLNTIKDSRFEHFTEPGHALIGNAVCLLTQIKAIKHSRGRHWGICDVGTDQVAKITLLGWAHKIYTHRGCYLPMSGQDALAGPLCFAGDTMLHHTDITGCQVGDPLLITTAGAYLFSMSNSFNGRTAPRWVVYEGGVYQKVTDREHAFNRHNLQYHYWQHPPLPQPVPVAPETVSRLQSHYLHTTTAEDTYEFLAMIQTAPKTYQFRVKATSSIGAVSMPLAIRILGDACIIAGLKELGIEDKNRSAWGEKLDLEYFGVLRTGQDFDIRVSMAEPVAMGHDKYRVLLSFHSTCERMRGAGVFVY